MWIIIITCCLVGFVVDNYRNARIRQIEFACQRGCWRSALELCKLLLSLDPDKDPLGALLMIDYLALRSGEYAYLRTMGETWRQSKVLDWLPNFAYSEVGGRP